MVLPGADIPGTSTALVGSVRTVGSSYWSTNAPFVSFWDTSGRLITLPKNWLRGHVCVVRVYLVCSLNPMDNEYKVGLQILYCTGINAFGSPRVLLICIWIPDAARLARSGPSFYQQHTCEHGGGALVIKWRAETFYSYEEAAMIFSHRMWCIKTWTSRTRAPGMDGLDLCRPYWEYTVTKAVAFTTTYLAGSDFVAFKSVMIGTRACLKTYTPP